MKRLTTAWVALGAITIAVALALDALELPSATLFGAMLVGLVVALRLPGRFVLRGRPVLAAHAATGVVLGGYLQSSSLESLAGAWLPVLLVSAATLGLSLAAGWAMARVTGIDPPTAALGMVAGGASGIIAMASELRADDRIVAFMQYVRVLLIVIATPLLVALLFGDHEAVVGAGQDDGPFLGAPQDWAITAAVAFAGALAGRAIRLPAATLMGPLLLAAGLTLALPEGSVEVPPIVREAAFAVIGLQVGLRFTVELFRSLARLLVPVIVSVVVLSAACFGFAVLLDLTSDASLLDAYLATTPGGLYAVLAAAVGTGADATFVVGVQSLRLVVMVLVAPFAVRAMVARMGRTRAASSPSG
jgi:membrane AbrB-like protein